MDTELMARRRAQLYSALKRAQRGEWLTRAQLATMTGKNRLSPNDVSHLMGLESDGFIESRATPSAGVRDFFEYRLKESGNG